MIFQNADSPPLKVLAVVGPTASGKSSLAIALAKQLGGEIINCDSVQVYRRLWIGTSKVRELERQGIPHHLIDIADPTENFTAGEFARRARAVIEEVAAGMKSPIVAGGSGFYFRALFKGLFEGPRTDLQLRARLKALLARRGARHLHRMLARVDRGSAARLAQADWSRTIRALEVFFQSRRPLSQWQKQVQPIPWAEADSTVLALAPDRPLLYERINRRTDQMFAAGWVEEVQSLISEGVPRGAQAFQAHGYRRIVEYLQGERSLESAIEQTKLDTRHYAKRQLTWWRHQADVIWLEGFGDSEIVQEEALELAKQWLSSGQS